MRRNLPPRDASEPVAAATPFAFVVRAFREELDDPFDYGVLPALSAAGLDARLATDEYATGESLIEKVYRLMRLSRVVVADLTIDRPNCFYELGFADALDKRTVLIARNGTIIPLDLAGREVIFYGNSRQLKSRLTMALRDALRE